MATSEPSPPSIDTSPISKGRVSITPKLLSNQQVEALLEDAKGLHRNGAFVPGGLRRRKSNRDGSDMTSTTDATTRICDICGLFDDAEKAGPSVGNMDAREELLDLMADLRELLQTYLSIRLSKGMELQYLRYPGISDGQSDGQSGEKKQKGFYGRHFDRDPEDKSCSCRRKVSLLLYLNTETWDAKKDGGVLRAYMPQKQQQKQATGKTRERSGTDEKGATDQDIVPKGGTLVLFDSASVEHEVLPTHRERWAVVGWFLEDEDDNRASMKRKKRDAKKNNGGEGKKSSAQHNHSRGVQQQRRRKKKKR